MIAVNLDRVSHSYLHDPVFENLSWEIHLGRVVGLVGPNGAGKSTLLNLIAGVFESESGFTNRMRGLSIGYLEQDPQFQTGITVLSEALNASVQLKKVESELKRIEGKLSQPDVYQNERKLIKVLAVQEKLLEDYVTLGGPGYEGQVEATLKSLGFRTDDLDLPVEVLSGGQKKMLGLAKLLILKPDLLLLDEPDNHLDLEGKRFLEQFLRNFSGAVVIVSHDRYLLDLVVDEIGELENGRLTQYYGNYSEYVFEKGAALLRQKQRFEAQKKEINRLEQSAKRLMLWGHLHDNEKFSQRGKSMLKRIEKIDRIEQPILERKQMGLELQGWRGSEKVLEIANLSMSFSHSDNPADPPKPLFTDLDLLIRRGERVGVVGPNGAGKSVLFKLILGELSQRSGDIYIGPSIEIGYYAQEQDTLDPDQTLIQIIRHAAECSESRAVATLGRFLFSYDQARGRVVNLSGGERSRLQMALLMLSGANFLMLDEPTNNLDIQSAEVLEEALENFEGTLLVISHDRYFLDRVVSHVIELEDGSINEYLGNYSEYERARRRIRI